MDEGILSMWQGSIRRPLGKSTWEVTRNNILLILRCVLSDKMGMQRDSTN